MVHSFNILRILILVPPADAIKYSSSAQIVLIFGTTFSNFFCQTKYLKPSSSILHAMLSFSFSPKFERKNFSIVIGFRLKYFFSNSRIIPLTVGQSTKICLNDSTGTGLGPTRLQKVHPASTSLLKCEMRLLVPRRLL